jgi:hypothetical protein
MANTRRTTEREKAPKKRRYGMELVSNVDWTPKQQRKTNVVKIVTEADDLTCIAIDRENVTICNSDT